MAEAVSDSGQQGQYPADEDKVASLNGKAYAEAPVRFTNWEKAEPIRFVDRDGDGVIRYSGDPETNELTVDRDIMLLAKPEIAVLAVGGQCPRCLAGRDRRGAARSAGADLGRRLGAEALDLRVTDIVMPGMSGADLAREAPSMYPGLSVLFVTRYGDHVLSASPELAGLPALQKPFTSATLCAGVRRERDGARSSQVSLSETSAPETLGRGRP